MELILKYFPNLSEQQKTQFAGILFEVHPFVP